MRVATYDRFGPPEVLRIEDIPKPEIKESEILVRVKAVAVTIADSRIRGARFPKGFGLLTRLIFGITKPRIRILGNTYSGVVEEVGKDITEFKPGDEVCGMTGFTMGAYAEFIKVGTFKSIAKKPANISHEDAAGVLFGGTAALTYIRDKAEVKAGEKVAINGASGAVGTNAVQLAVYYGAEVTGVTSADNAELVKGLGAKHVIDYQKQNLTDSKEKFDVVLDIVGNIPLEADKTLLTDNGRLALVVADLWKTLRAIGRAKTGVATEKKEDMEFLLSLVEQGKLKVVIEKIYDFSDIVSAHARVDTGRKVGNVLARL